MSGATSHAQETREVRSTPDPTAGFPRTRGRLDGGYHLYVGHDGKGFRYYGPAEGGLREWSREEALGLVGGRLRTADPTWPIVLALAAALGIAVAADLVVPGVVLFVLLLLTAAVLPGHVTEAQRVRIFYDAEHPEVAGRLQALRGFAEALGRSAHTWVHPGPERLRLAPPSPRVRTTPETPLLSMGPRELRLLPDGLLAWQGSEVRFFDLAALQGSSETFEEVTAGPVPVDTPRVGTVWKYTRKDGQPDQRRRNNPRLPVVRMGRLQCMAGDLSLTLVTSRPEAALEAGEALQRLVDLAAGRIRTEPGQGLNSLEAPRAAAPPPTAEVLPAPGRPSPAPVRPRTAAPAPAAQAQPAPPQPAPARPTPVPAPTPAPAQTGTTPSGRASKAPPAAWIPPGTPVTVAGYTIPDGMVYVGRGRPARTLDDLDGARVDPDLPVDSSRPDYTDGGFRWPFYSQMSPQQRAGYLEWLQGGRSRPGIAPSFVEAFCFGLERRALVDGARDPSTRSEWPRLAEELERLQQLYPDQSRSAAQLLQLLRLHQDLDAAQELRLRRGPPLSLRVVLGISAREGMPLAPETACAWAVTEPQCALGERAMRTGGLLATLFSLRYRERFPEGLVPVPRKGSQLTYEGMSLALNRVSLAPFLGQVPEVRVERTPLAKARQLLVDCAEELDAYNRYLGRRPDGGQEPAALALLPRELVDLAEGPELKQLRLFLRARLDREPHAALPLPDLLERWPLRTPGQLDKADALAMAQYLQKADIGLEPDVRFGSTASSFQQHAVAFQLPPGSPTAPSDAYNAACLVLQCAATVAAADGSIAPEEEAHLVAHLEQALELSAGERERLRARLRLLLLQPPSITGLKKQLQALGLEPRKALAEFLVLTATADGRIEPAEVKALTRIFEMLDLDPGTLYSRLHQVSAAGSAPAARAPAAGGEGLQLDAALLERRMAETHQLSSLLATVFTEDEAPPPPAAAEPVATVAGLDGSHSRFFHRLVARPEWTRAEIEALAAELGLMPDGALDRLNEAALDQVGDPLCDGEDPVLVDLQVGKEMNGEH